MNSLEILSRKIKERKHICVGLDTDISKIPKHILKFENPILEFNKQIIQATSNHANSYKINLAFYEKLGTVGLETMQQTIELIPEDLLIIGDAKRGDIGNTAKMYASSLFDYFKFGASTINPLMGFDSVQPFLDYKNKLNFVLGLTSNPSANDFEKLKLENGKYLFEQIIETSANWGENVGFVFGATNIDFLKNAIPLFKNRTILLPGVGAQGGSLEEVVKTFYSENYSNFIINVSRGILYLDSTTNFTSVAEKKIIDYNETIKKIIDSI